MSYNFEKLQQIAVDPPKEVLEQDHFMRENKDWLRKSAKIALCVRRVLRVKGITQQELAARMNVSPQYVGRILKGQENLTLAVIAKLERALQVTIISIGIEEPVKESAEYTYQFPFNRGDWVGASKSKSRAEQSIQATS